MGTNLSNFCGRGSYACVYVYMYCIYQLVRQISASRVLVWPPTPLMFLHRLPHFFRFAKRIKWGLKLGPFFDWAFEDEANGEKKQINKKQTEKDTTKSSKSMKIKKNEMLVFHGKIHLKKSLVLNTQKLRWATLHSSIASKPSYPPSPVPLGFPPPWLS